MVDIEKLDNELYKARYINKNIDEYNKIWLKIKKMPEVLREAVKIKRNKWDNGDIVNGLAICEAILKDYENVDKFAYNTLINNIYSNTDIARIVIDGASNGGNSFLLMSFLNQKLKLTEEQKSFAVSEAMNKIGTTKHKKESEFYSKELEKNGITDDITTTIDIDGLINPIGAKTKNEYLNSLLTMLSRTQAHGENEFDIRYYILKSSNWSLEEKKSLIRDFWYDDDEYDEYLEQWEWNIVNDSVNYKENEFNQFDKYYMYEYSYKDLLRLYGNRDITDRIWEEIRFCNQMHELRPEQWELEPMPIKKKINNKTKK